jgi:hypothetical protein
VTNSGPSAQIVEGPAPVAPGEPVMLQVLDNGSAVGTFLAADVQSITIDAGPGSNLVTVVTPPNPCFVTDSTGTAALVMGDSADPTARTMTVTGTTVSSLAGLISYAPDPGFGVSSLTIMGGSGSNIIDVQSTSVPTAIHSQGNDTVVVSDNGSAQGIQANLSIDNTGGCTALAVDDSADATPRTVTLTSSTITGLAPAAIAYGPGVCSLTVTGGSGGNIFAVKGTAALSGGTTLNAGAGGDAVNIGSPTNTLDPIQGAVSVNGYVIAGQGSNTTLNVHDDGNPVSENYTVSPTTIQRSIIVAGVYNFNIATITYNEIGHAAVYVGSAQTGVNEGAPDFNTLDVVGTMAGTVTDLYGNNNGGQTAFSAYPYVFTYAGPILGPVHFHGSSIGLDTLYYVDYFNPTAQTYTMSAGQMIDNGFAPVTYDGRLYAVGLETSVVGGSNVNVLSTAGPPAVGIAAQVLVNARDTVTVGSQAPNLGGNLAGLAGSGILSIQSIYPTSPASVILDDSTDTQMGKQVTFSTVSSVWEVNGLAPLVIELTMAAGSNVQVLGGSPAAGQNGGNTYDIESVPVGVSLALKAGTGADTVNVGSAANTLDPIEGPVTVNGQGANTTLNVHDDGTTNSQDYSVYADSIHRFDVTTLAPNMAAIGYSGIGHLALYQGSAQAVINFGAIRNSLVVYSSAKGTTTTFTAGPARTSTRSGRTMPTRELLRITGAFRATSMSTAIISSIASPTTITSIPRASRPIP